MLRKIMKMLRPGARGNSAGGRALPSIDRSEIASFLSVHQGLPQLDWGAAEAWIERKATRPGACESLKRAVAAAWLDELRDALTDDHRRWRNVRVEGLAPLEGNNSQRVARGTDGAIKVIEKALRPIRGDDPIPPFAVVALNSSDNYYSFISHFYPEEGEWGTSGGVYINDGADSFPIIALPTNLQWALEQTVAHELTHHSLRGAELPIWVEEGLTQMMEERVTGVSNFRLDREMLSRQRDRWLDGDLESYLSGASFSSAEDDTQELAYHLSQLVVRGLLSREPDRFFEFARACRKTSWNEAALEHIGQTPEELIERALNVQV